MKILAIYWVLFVQITAFAEKILHIGDSLSVSSAKLGPALHNHLKSKGNTVASYALCGASVRTWIQDSPKSSCGVWKKDYEGNESQTTRGTAPDLESLLSTKPDHVVVQLGTNHLTGGNASKETYKAEITRMLSAIGSKKCTWIGPPSARESQVPRSRINLFYEALNEATEGRCRVIDSRVDASGNPNPYPSSGGDGLHYYSKEGQLVEKKWIEKIKSEF